MDSTSLLVALAGALVLLSWIGYGGLLHKLLRLPVRPHWSLLAALGAGVTLVVAGPVLLFHLASIPLLNTLTFLGLAAIPFTLSRPVLHCLRPHPFSVPLLIAVVAITLVSVHNAWFNPADDLLAYLVFPKQLLQSGTLLAPFTMRRLGTYGGHPFLQAQLLALVHLLGGSSAFTNALTHGHLLDDGLATCISAGLLWNRFRHRRAAALPLTALLVTASFLLLPIPRANTHAQTTGTMFFLALAAILPALRRPHFTTLLTVAILAAALATLRMNFLAAAALAILLTTLFSRSTFLFQRSAFPLLLTALFLSPWALLLYRSSGTPFYPLFRGFESGQFLQAPLSLSAHFRWSAMSLLYPKLLMTLLPFSLTLAVRQTRTILPLYAAAIAMTAALAWSFTNEDTANIYRLSSPILFACALLALGHLLRNPRTQQPARVVAILLLFAIPAFCDYEYSEAFRFTDSLLLLPLVLLLPFLTWSRRPLAEALVLIATLCVFAIIAFTARTRLADNGSVFFFTLAEATLVAFAALTHRPWIRPAALVATALLILLQLPGLYSIYGPFILGCLLVMLLAAGYLSTFAHKYLPWIPAVLALAALTLMTFLQYPFLLDKFSPFLFALIPGGALLFASRTPSVAVRWIALLVATATLLPFADLRSLPVSPGHYPLALLADYQAAQSRVPPGVPLFVLTPAPACLDFARNPLLVTDLQPHVVSLPPGLPRNAPPAAFQHYWHDAQIPFLLLSTDSILDARSGIPPDVRNNFAALTLLPTAHPLPGHLVVVDCR